jgi:hypothetical protein
MNRDYISISKKMASAQPHFNSWRSGKEFGIKMADDMIEIGLLFLLIFRRIRQY